MRKNIWQEDERGNWHAREQTKAEAIRDSIFTFSIILFAIMFALHKSGVIIPMPIKIIVSVFAFIGVMWMWNT